MQKQKDEIIMVVYAPYAMRPEDKEILRRSLVRQLQEGDVVVVPMGTKVEFRKMPDDIVIETKESNSESDKDYFELELRAIKEVEARYMDECG